MNLRTIEFQILETSANIRRNGLMTAAAIGNSAACLFVLGGFVLAMWNLESLMHALSTESRVLVYFHKTIAYDDAQAFTQSLREQTGGLIAEAQLVPREQVLEEFARSHPDISTAGLGAENNPFPHELRLTLRDPSRWSEVSNAAWADKRVADVRAGQQVLEALTRLRRIGRSSGVAVVALLGLAALLTISNTIRLTIHARRREIGIMQTVGATPTFIRVPFMLEGIFHGTFGAAIGASILLLGYSSLAALVSENVPAFDRWIVYGTAELGFVLGGLVATGFLFGLIGSWLAVGRYLES